MARLIVRLLLRMFFRVRVDGTMEPHSRLLIVANHQSFLDPFVLGAYLPVRPVWVVHTTIASRWYFKIGLRFTPHVVLDTSKSMAMKAIVAMVEAGTPVLIFPEGRITNTGSVMKIYDGPAMVAAKTGAAVVPVHIEGAVHSVFSRMSGDFPRRLFPRIRATILPPCRIEPVQGVSPKVRRRMQSERLRRIIQEAQVESRPRDLTLFPALLDAVRLHGRRRTIMEDARGEMTYGQLVKASLGLARLVSRMTQEGETVAVLMPNLSATVALLFGMWSSRRVPAILNFTAGVDAMQKACRLAQVRLVITSRAFLERARLTETAARLHGVRLVYLEDLRSEMRLADKLWVLRGMIAPRSAALPARPEDPAAVMFTSGSEGTPKGVVLSHASMLANIAQYMAVLDYSSKDKFMNVLPLFHAFGLTVGAVAPLLRGARVFIYPTPLHYRLIPETIYDRDCTVLFATGTFLGHYGRNAHPYDFHKLRIVIAGAEKTGEDVRRLYMEKFGIRILDGYGATECSPGLSVNTPMVFQAGTVGQLLPGIEYRLAPVPGIDEGGMLHVHGPNNMLGYLTEEGGIRQARSQFGPGWYETGDIVSVDGNSMVTIIGRMRRFAKVAGEMVSLELVEKVAVEASPDYQHASAALPEPGRGETVLLFTQDPNLRRERLVEAARRLGAPELAVPRRVVYLAQLPVLGNGKKDYATIARMAGNLAPSARLA